MDEVTLADDVATETVIVTEAATQTANTTVTGDAEVLDELLVEEISIDGMCGVY
jgi:mycofactocin precursor